MPSLLSPQRKTTLAAALIAQNSAPKHQQWSGVPMPQYFAWVFHDDCRKWSSPIGLDQNHTATMLHLQFSPIVPGHANALHYLFALPAFSKHSRFEIEWLNGHRA